MTNWPPPFKKKTTPHQDTTVHFATSIFSPRDWDQLGRISLSLIQPQNPRKARSEKGGGEKRWNEKEAEEKKKRWWKGEEHKVLRVSRKCFIHAAYAEVPSSPSLSLSLSLSPSPSPRFTKRAHRQRVVSNFNYKPEEERWTRVFRNAAGMWN